jgi:hypothetical protein
MSSATASLSDRRAAADRLPTARPALSPLGKRRVAQFTETAARLPATAYLTEAALLVDELLSLLLVQAARNPDALNPADFTFAQKCQLLQAFYDTAFEGWLYHALRLLDAARQKWTQRFSEQAAEEPLQRFLAVASSAADAGRRPGLSGVLFNAAVLRVVQALRRGLPGA